MTEQDDLHLDPRMKAAIEELRSTIASRYPTATFDVSYGIDGPPTVHLIVTVDLYDPFEVHDLVSDRLVDLQVDEGIPIRVTPLSTPEQVRAQMADWQRRHGGLDAPAPGGSLPGVR